MSFDFHDADGIDGFDSATPEQEANGLWTNGTNDDVWDAIFGPGGLTLAEHLLERIERTDFTVGDLTHEECVAAILRRYPILGPNPHFGR